MSPDSCIPHHQLGSMCFLEMSPHTLGALPMLAPSDLAAHGPSRSRSRRPLRHRHLIANNMSTVPQAEGSVELDSTALPKRLESRRLVLRARVRDPLEP